MLLMEEAERIAREEHFSKKISVISGKSLETNIVFNLQVSCSVCFVVNHDDHFKMIVSIFTPMQLSMCYKYNC